ncbi:MAG: SusC/RagA family TonB-linked outer membrane protein [Bacteroidota bacterium]
MRKLRFLALLLLLSSVVMAQTRLISGTIKDSKTGSPLPSVTVKVKGKNISALTNTDGGFSLNVPAGISSLEVSSVGYSAKTVSVDAGASTVEITMDASSAALSEVVVTALGISKQSRKLGYAVTSVNGDQLSKARETNVALGLEGQVAGLNIHGTSGGPAGSARILLRGVSSLTGGGSPLFVINGVPIDNQNRGSAGEWGGSDNGDGIGNINPDDIESMTVLKGLSASALYGSRAANGVILITTKTGKRGTVNIEYNSNFVVDRAINSTDFQYVYGQGTGGAKPASQSSAQATARFAWGAKMDGSSYTGFDGKTYNYSPYKDNIKDFYRWGPSFTNTVSVNGGGDRGTYRLSLSNLSNDAIVRGSGLGRKTINFNVDQKVTDKLSFQIMANYIDQKATNPPQLSDGPGNPNNGMFLAPNIKESTLSPGYDANGREIVFSDDNYVTNPYFAVNKWVNDINRKRLISAISAKYSLTDWLYIQGRAGYDKEDDRALGVTPTGTDYSYSAGQSGSINITTQQKYELNLDALLGVSHKLTKDISLDATVGGNSRRNKQEALGVGGGPFVIPNLYTPGNVLSFNRSYSYQERAVHSGYYSLDFSYRDFLTLGTTGRFDAFSTLYNSGIPKDQRNVFTPSVSGSFIFSQFTHIPALSYGKLRASYAKTSGEPVNPYQTAVYYSVGNAINGVSTGSFSGTLPNLFLKPYTLTEFEFGTELKFLKNRLGLDVSYFQRKSSNEIMNAGLSWATGYNSSVIANGSIQNKGVEVLITGTPVKTTNFNWNMSFNLTSIANKVLKTDANGNSLGEGNYRPLNANTAYVVGLAGPQVQAHDYTYSSKGQIVVDASGLPVQGGLINMGSVLPKLYGGFKNDFSYKGFDFSFLLDYNFGNKVLSATKDYALVRGLDKATLVGRETGIVVNGVLADGTTNTKSASAESYYQRLASISRGNVLNGDYIKLRQVTLGYTISEKALAKVPIFSSIQISLVGRNLITFLKHTDNIDPEAGFSSTIAYAGIEGTSLPSVRSFGFNANFKFKK